MDVLLSLKDTGISRMKFVSISDRFNTNRKLSQVSS